MRFLALPLLSTAVAAALLAAAPAASADRPLTPIGDLQRGTMVTVAGVVERITDEDEFRLTDATGTVRVYVGPNWVPAAVGEAITVDGFVDDGLSRKEIYARSLTRADGTVIAFEHRYD
jgi:uncharacterized protein YdeI (BOF family)